MRYAFGFLRFPFRWLFNQVRQPLLHLANVDFELVLIFQFSDPFLVVSLGPRHFLLQFVHLPCLTRVFGSVFVNLAHPFLLLSKSPDPPFEVLVSVLQLPFQLLYPKLELLLVLVVSGRLADVLSCLDQLGHSVWVFGLQGLFQ